MHSGCGGPSRAENASSKGQSHILGAVDGGGHQMAVEADCQGHISRIAAGEHVAVHEIERCAGGDFAIEPWIRRTVASHQPMFGTRLP